MYWCILNYRKGEDSPKIAYLHNNSWTCFVMLFMGIFLVMFNLLIGHPAIADPYLWSTLENQLYMSVLRLSYVIALCLILIPIFTGKFNLGMHLLSSSNMRALGKLTYVNVIIAPIVISLLYDTAQDPMYVSFNVVLFLGIGNAFCCTVFSLILLVLFEFPMRTILSPLKKMASHDHLLMA